MTETKSIVKQSSAAIATQVERYNMMTEFVKSVMVANKDYGLIPGTQKPTLLKPGAEKLTSLFDLYPEFEIVQSVTDWDKGLFFYQYRCLLRHRQSGEIYGTGLGSCNSKESKYRYRYTPSLQKPTKDEAAKLKAQGLGRWRKDGDSWQWQERIENDQIYDILNTIDKMAQKRAYIAATLIACNASEFFTQDVEDMPFFGDYVEGEWKEQAVIPIPQPENKPTHEQPEQPVQAPPVTITLEEAMLEQNSKGEAYGDIDTTRLGYMANAMLKLASDKRTPEHDRKLEAIHLILAARQESVQQ